MTPSTSFVVQHLIAKNDGQSQSGHDQVVGARFLFFARWCNKLGMYESNA